MVQNKNEQKKKKKKNKKKNMNLIKKYKQVHKVIVFGNILLSNCCFTVNDSNSDLYRKGKRSKEISYCVTKL